MLSVRVLEKLHEILLQNDTNMDFCIVNDTLLFKLAIWFIFVPVNMRNKVSLCL